MSAALLGGLLLGAVLSDGPVAPLPDGVGGSLEDVMSLTDAWTSRTPTRVRYSLNGLWQSRAVGATNAWEWLKVPLAMKGVDPHRVYRRAFEMPKETAGRRVRLRLDLFCTHAWVRLDGRPMGEGDFPSAEFDLTEAVRPGARQVLEVEVVGAHLDKETLDYNAGFRAAAKVVRRLFRGGGLTGDVFLDVLPPKSRLADPWVECSAAKGRVTFKAECAHLPPDGVRLRADVTGCGARKRFESGVIRPDAEGVLSFSSAWKDARPWNFRAATNLYDCTLSLMTVSGKLLDVAHPFTFGFREMSIEGNRLLMNGVPIHLRMLLVPIACMGPDLSNLDACRETCRRLKEEGYNCITDQYGSVPGSYAYNEAILQACDEFGIAYIHTLPHVKDYGGAETFLTNETGRAAYTRVARHFVKAHRNHPSVIAYAINHNMAGYLGDFDPLANVDSRRPPPAVDDTPKRRAAHAGYEIVRRLDPTRPCYHHAGGDLDDIITTNTYLDWVPRQERSDWFGAWSTRGTKPWILVEYGMPHIANWSSYRGPQFIWDARVYQSIVAAEAASSFLGDAMFSDAPATHAVLAAEEALWAKGRPWSWMREMHEKVMELDCGYQEVLCYYMADNWRSMRAWGLTGALPWDQKRAMFRLERPARPCENPDRFRNLKRPGVVPDRLGVCDQYFIDAGDRGKWRRQPIADVIRRWNQDDCAFIGGDEVFTDKAHHVRPGETFRKRLVIVNDRFEATDYAWHVNLVAESGQTVTRQAGRVRVAPGTRGEVPVELMAPVAGDYTLKAAFAAPGWSSTDSFEITALAAATGRFPKAVALYDPKGLTAANFDRLGVPYRRIRTVQEARTAACVTHDLVVGRESLTRDLLDAVLYEQWSRARLLVFEQTKDTLESIGFRVQEYGLRNAFPRFEDDALGRLTEGLLRDWAGASTLIATAVSAAEAGPGQIARYPETTWAGYTVARPYRAGLRGSVATVLPEKPTCGDFRPLADGGWGLQYAPLIDWRVEFGRVTFCQFDVTGRTTPEPAADELVRRLVRRLVEEKELPDSVWVKPHGKDAWTALHNGNWGVLEAVSHPGRQVHLVTSGAEKPDGFDDRVAREGLRVLCVGLTAEETRRWSPVPLEVVTTNGAHFTRMEKFPKELNGVSNAELAWHGAMSFAAIGPGVGEGTAALRVIRHGKGHYVFMQLAPWKIDDFAKPYLRTTKRRTWQLFCRILGAMDAGSRNHRAHYADAPVLEDDPYRYFCW